MWLRKAVAYRLDGSAFLEALLPLIVLSGLSENNSLSQSDSYMDDGKILIVKGPEVVSLLAGREHDLIDQVRMAYEIHAGGESSLPHTTFLNFPDRPRDRITALPAYLGGENRIVGIKWVASFPGNLAMKFDRASAVVILNSPETGRPTAILEGSVISAKRTAASAALAAQQLCLDGQSSRLGVVGCGLINFEVVRFLTSLWPTPRTIIAFDLDLARATRFQQKCRELSPGIELEISPDVQTVLSKASLISLATTASQPHISDLAECAPGSVILHVSLRDLSPQVILASDNIVDDLDHVCRAQTSIHLAEQLVGHRNFVRCNLAEILLGKATVKRNPRDVTIFSPFGLGILDIAVSQFVYELAIKEGRGTSIDSFLPDPWDQKIEESMPAGL